MFHLDSVSGRLIRLPIFLVILILLCPIRAGLPNPTIDGSWVFGVNLAALRNMVVGTDFIWVTGPLAYLAMPFDMGNHLTQGLLFQFAIWVFLAVFLYFVVFRNGHSIANLLFFTAGCLLSLRLYYFNYMGLEYLLLMPFFYYLHRGLMGKGDTWTMIVAGLCAGVSGMIKMSGLTIAGATIGAYLLIGSLIDWRKYLGHTVILGVTALATTLAVFQAMYGDAGALVQYLRTSSEQASEFSVGWTHVGDVRELFAAFAIVLAMSVLAILLSRGDWRASLRLTLYAPALFGAFKHGFVRHDMHVVVFFYFAAMVIGIMLLVEEIGSLWKPVLAVSTAVVALWAFPAFTQDEPWIGLPRALYNALLSLRPGKLAASLDQRVNGYDWPVRLDPAMQARIGSERVTSPIGQITFLWKHCPGLELFPIQASYQAYTTGLDGLNARYLEERGPKFVVLTWRIVDGRHPLADAPLTLSVLQKWYQTDMGGGGDVLLLSRRSTPRPVAADYLRDAAFGKTLDEEPQAGAVQLELAGLSPIRKTLWRIEPVYLAYRRSDGEITRFRVMPNVLRNPIPIGQLPNNLKEASCFFQDGCALTKSPVDKVWLEGDGVSSYAPAALRLYKWKS